LLLDTIALIDLDIRQTALVHVKPHQSVKNNGVA
jgi:hypothetical protein